MRIYIILATLLLTGCATQSPAPTVAAFPSTYKPIPGLNPSKSNVSKKLQLVNAKPSWIWPVEGNIMHKFAANSTKKGIDIAGIEGMPVVAAADGEVVYSGNSLKGYGNLIIIKHKKNFITAYAHNQKNMVKEGDTVLLGQRIALMGKSGTDKVKLHFEVRQDGKPVDPQLVLPKK